MVAKVSRYARFVNADLLCDLAHTHLAHGDGLIQRFSPGMRAELALSSRFPFAFVVFTCGLPFGLKRCLDPGVPGSRAASAHSCCRRFATKRNGQHRFALRRGATNGFRFMLDDCGRVAPEPF
jgi:hypothetical protein